MNDEKNDFKKESDGKNERWLKTGFDHHVSSMSIVCFQATQPCLIRAWSPILAAFRLRHSRQLDGTISVVNRK